MDAPGLVYILFRLISLNQHHSSTENQNGPANLGWAVWCRRCYTRLKINYDVVRTTGQYRFRWLVVRVSFNVIEVGRHV